MADSAVPAIGGGPSLPKAGEGALPKFLGLTVQPPATVPARCR